MAKRKTGILFRISVSFTAVMAVGLIVLAMTSCHHESPETVNDMTISDADYGTSPIEESDSPDVEHIAALSHDIYAQAAENSTLGSLETMQRIVARLGENGYAAVDSENQVNMENAEQVLAFCQSVEEKKNVSLTILVVMTSGLRKFELKTKDGNVDIIREYYQYDQNGSLQNRNTVSYPADVWQCTEEGYLLFSGSFFSEENYVFTMSSGVEHTALRILPLDEKCRELNRKYILPVGYEQNNIFLTDWSEEDFGNLDFYDIFDKFYPASNQRFTPYPAGGKLETGASYEIPEEIFEDVIMTYFRIDKKTLQSKTTYLPANKAYEYRVRGFYEAEYSYIPYPEVVNYTENQDGTITLTVNAVYPHEDTSKSYAHKTIVRPIDENHFQYMSNQLLTPEDEYDTWWHSDRLTEEEWRELYGGNSASENLSSAN